MYLLSCCSKPEFILCKAQAVLLKMNDHDALCYTMKVEGTRGCLRHIWIWMKYLNMQMGLRATGKEEFQRIMTQIVVSNAQSYCMYDLTRLTVNVVNTGSHLNSMRMNRWIFPFRCTIHLKSKSKMYLARIKIKEKNYT